MNEYTWEDWCWDSTVEKIADALYLDFYIFIRKISKFDRTSYYKVRMLARLSDLCKRGKLSWDELIGYEEDEIDVLYGVIVDYIGRNKEYVARIERVMLEEERRLKDET